jgi:amidase
MSAPFFSPQFKYTWGPHDVALHVESGATLSIICPDSDNGLADASALSPAQRQQSTGTPLFEGNPLAGPIAIHGLEPGDCLAVEVKEIQLDRTQGATLLAPDHGLLSRRAFLGAEPTNPRELVPRHLYQWQIDLHQRIARAANPLGDHPLVVPLRPMIGSFGVCPRAGGEISSLLAGDFGGNLDLPLIAPGATVLLPVFASGGGLLLGDLHAAQGAGEIVGGGIETSGVVSISLRKLANRAITAPRVIADNRIFAVATAHDLRVAISTAYSRLLDWLAQELQMHRADSYQLISQAGVLELGGIINQNCQTVAAGIAVRDLPQPCQQELARWLGSAGE